VETLLYPKNRERTVVFLSETTKGKSDKGWR